MEYLSLGENVSSHLGLLVNESVSHSVLSDFLRPHGLWPTRLLCLWNSPGKNIAVGHHSLLQRIFLTCEAVIKPILLWQLRIFLNFSMSCWEFPSRHSYSQPPSLLRSVTPIPMSGVSSNKISWKLRPLCPLRFEGMVTKSSLLFWFFGVFFWPESINGPLRWRWIIF